MNYAPARRVNITYISSAALHLFHIHIYAICSAIYAHICDTVRLTCDLRSQMYGTYSCGQKKVDEKFVLFHFKVKLLVDK
jgi:hypothetical protein